MSEHDAKLEEAKRESDEFPAGVTDAPSEISRREVLRLMGSAAALAGAGACTQPPREKILPYAEQPPEVRPGIPSHYATAMVIDGYARPLLVESHEGRPTKVEGNPQHPASLGGSGVLEQASVLSLYDPDRARGLLRRGYDASWNRLAQTIDALRSGRGAVRFVMEPTSSPLLIELIRRVRERWPQARFTFLGTSGGAGVGGGPNVWEAGKVIAGGAVEPIIDFTRAAVVLSLDCDFMAQGAGALHYARDFAGRRRGGAAPGGADNGGMGGGNRLYMVEPTPSPTGTLAEHRLRRRASDVGAVGAAVLGALLREATGVAAGLAAAAGLDRFAGAAPAEWVSAVARDLLRNPGSSVVVAGARQPAAVHAIAAWINGLLGNDRRLRANDTSAVVSYIRPPIHEAGEASHDLRPLVDELRAGEVDAVVVLGVNASYLAPAELELSAALRRAPESIYLGAYTDETAADCGWFVAANHYLESWGDARSFDGTVSFTQPLISPLHGGRDASDLLGLFLPEEARRSAYDELVEAWRLRNLGPLWEQMLQRGFVDGSRAQPVIAPTGWQAAAALVASYTPAADGLELIFPPSPSVHDGRFANNARLQEHPDPTTSIVWDNAAFMSPATARQHELSTGDLVKITAGGRSLTIPACVVPGQADGSLTIHQGYGRRGSEGVARGVGANAGVLRAAGAPAFTGGATIAKGGGTRRLARTQLHWSMEDRDLALTATTAQLAAENPARKQRGPLPSLLPTIPQHGKQWGMVIDLGVCNGCSACVAACVAENNTPVVGRDNVLNSREMHWLRIDRYHLGSGDDPQIVSQPMMCQHCETAPCEYVCPVNATVHSEDGLNEMAYNRCVGTRFCSNNCPYKVRRFNFFDYVMRDARSLAMNPNVTVRERGVMEKCTYCVQRIRSAELRERVDGRPVELQTACQQACPTRAISFGDIAEPSSQVSRWRKNDRVYSVLHDQGTRPRTQYLVKVTDPNGEAGRGGRL